MQDAGDSPPTGNAARGGKGSAFPPLTASVRTGKGIGLRSAEPRSRSVWQALYPLSDCFSSGCFSECFSECLRNGCGASRAAKAAWARQGGGCEMRQGTVRCGSRRRDRYGEFVRGSTRGIGAANRSCESAQTTDAKEIAKRITPVECTGIGAEICAGYWCRELRGNLRQEFASGICVRRLALKFAGGGDCPVDGAVGLKIGTARNRYKKRPRKNRGHTVELNFRAEVSAATHIGWTKQSSFFHRLQDPKFRLSRRRIRGTVCTANSRLFFRPRVYSGLPAPAPCFGSKRLPRFRLRVPTS